MILITDAIVDCTERQAGRYRAWAKAEQVTTFGLVLNSHVGELEKLCQHCHTVATLGVDSGAVQQVLGV